MGFFSGEGFGAIASIGGKIAGTFLSAKGEADSGGASEASLAYRASVARNNAKLAEKAADDAITRGRQDISRQAIGARQLIGRQRTALAANGVVVDRGSALDLTLDTTLLAQLDFEQTLENSMREAEGFLAQGEAFTEEASLLGQQEDFVGDQTRRNVASTFLSGAGSVANKWFDFTASGIFD